MTTAVAAAMEEKKAYKNIEEEERLSIYNIHSELKKKIILFIMCLLGFLSLFDELMYLSVLPVIIKDFKTTETLGLCSISVYLVTVSISSLIWGVLSDYYGRKLIATFALGAFTLSSLGCYFSPNIYIFIGFRALQGCLVSATVVVAQGTIADIYHPNDRGNAYGLFYAFTSFAGISAPVLDGQIAYFYGWRSIFILVTIISSVVLISYMLILSETQQYKVICIYQDQRKITLLESDQISKPVLTNPCLSLSYYYDSTIIPYALVMVCVYATGNCAIVLLSVDMDKSPYFYRENTIGLLFLPIGIIYIFGSIIGGKLSDLIAVKYFQTSKILEGRMIPSLVFSVFTILGLTLYGWSVQYGINVFVPLLGQNLFMFGMAGTIPGILSYLTIKHQDHAASISSAATFFQTFVSAIILTFTGQIVQTIHDGPYLTLLALCNILATTVATVQLYRRVRLSNDSETKLLL